MIVDWIEFMTANFFLMMDMRSFLFLYLRNESVLRKYILSTKILIELGALIMFE